MHKKNALGVTLEGTGAGGGVREDPAEGSDEVRGSHRQMEKEEDVEEDVLAQPRRHRHRAAKKTELPEQLQRLLERLALRAYAIHRASVSSTAAPGPIVEAPATPSPPPCSLSVALLGEGLFRPLLAEAAAPVPDSSDSSVLGGGVACSCRAVASSARSGHPAKHAALWIQVLRAGRGTAGAAAPEGAAAAAHRPVAPGRQGKGGREAGRGGARTSGAARTD